MRTDRVIDRERTGTLWVEVSVPWFYECKMSGVKRQWSAVHVCGAHFAART